MTGFENLHEWLLGVLLPIVAGVIVSWIAVRVKIAELARDVSHIELTMRNIEACLPLKADREIVQEMRHDIKEIKEMLTEHIIESAGGTPRRMARSKKNNGNT
jgi:hypothetical protein